MALDRLHPIPHIAGMDVPAILQRLIERGFTQAVLAERLFTTQQSVSRWQRGEREPGGAAMHLLEELAVEAGIIGDERTAPGRERIVQIMGRVGAGAEIEPDYEQVPPDGVEQFELPFPIDDDMIGFRVIGDSMAPTYEVDAIILVAREQPYDTGRMIGLAAAIVAYGPAGERLRYLKRIRAGARPHTFNLESINDRSPTLKNVRVIWASPVRMIIPNIGLRQIPMKRRASSGRKPAAGKES